MLLLSQSMLYGSTPTEYPWGGGGGVSFTLRVFVSLNIFFLKIQ